MKVIIFVTATKPLDGKQVRMACVLYKLDSYGQILYLPTLIVAMDHRLPFFPVTKKN